MDKLEKLKQLKITLARRSMSRLPEEVLIEIFGYLVGRKQRSDLLNATRVCKRWNKLIWSCPRLIDRLKLVIKFENFDRYSDKNIDFGQFETEKHYRNVLFSFRSVNSRGDYNDIVSIKIMEKIVDLHKNITTVEIRCMKLEPEHMRILSLFTHLRSLTFSDYSASYCKDVARRDFKNLRFLKHTNSSTVLFNFMECNQLIKLEIRDICSSDQDKNGNDFVNFLNQLDRCDQLTAEIPNWNFKVQLKPKFLWKKLNLKCKYSFTKRTNDEKIAPNIEALCRASASNAESKVWFSSLQREDLRLWPVVLNNCRGIHTLELTNTVEPEDVTNLNELFTVKTLVINAEALARPRFNQFLALKLPNVTSLEFNTWSKVTLEFKQSTLVSIEPFLNQITDLKIPYDYVHPVRYKTVGPPKLFEQANFVFKNLQTLTIQPTTEHLCMPDSLCLKKEIVSFCARHPNLHHLTVNVGCPTEIYTCKKKSEFKMDDLILGWYKKFYGKTAIKTCDVRIEVEWCDYGLKNWRKMRGVTETMLFWRPLTADESRFFV